MPGILFDKFAFAIKLQFPCLTFLKTFFKKIYFINFKKNYTGTRTIERFIRPHGTIELLENHPLEVDFRPPMELAPGQNSSN